MSEQPQIAIVPVPRDDLALLIDAAERAFSSPAPPGSRLNGALKRCSALLDDGRVTVSRKDLRVILQASSVTCPTDVCDRLAAAAEATP